jgi:hypothetical protein
MNRQEALHTVANHIAGLVETEEFEGVTGHTEGELPEADEERLEWARDEVARRLRAMGQSRRT